jgi:hypothetical protein
VAHQKFRSKSSLQNVLWTVSLVFIAQVSTHSVVAQTVQSVTPLNIDDPRPVAKAIDELVARYGYVITYEDPRHAYEADLQDVTSQVRRDMDHYPPGKAPKIIVPRGGKLTINLPSTASVNTQTVAAVLDQLTRSQSTRGEGGHFRVLQSGDIFHVVPSEIRDRNGNWAAQSSILDVPISLPAENRGKTEMLAAIVTAVSSTARVKMVLGGGIGGGIFNPNRPASYSLGADNEPARDVLVRALILLNDPKAGAWISQRLRWELFYGADENTYFLNISTVPDRPTPQQLPGTQQISNGVKNTSTGSTTGGTSVSPKN